MNTLEPLRPEIRPIDAEWSTETLETIFASYDPAPKPRDAKGRRLVVVGATAAGILGLGGVAYATGVVPTMITDHFAQTSSAAVTDVHELASFTTAKGGTDRSFEIWRGTDVNGRSCTAVVEADAKGGPDFSGNCGAYPTDAWFNTASQSYKGSIDDAPPPSIYYVYGEPTLPGVTEVRVTGDGFEHVTAVNATGGYAVAIPELDRGISGPFATVEFLDASDAVIGTKELSEK